MDKGLRTQDRKKLDKRYCALPGKRKYPIPDKAHAPQYPLANDGIVSVAGPVVGVAGATTARGPLFTAGIAGLVAGAVSMALGEYVSVSSPRRCGGC